MYTRPFTFLLKKQQIQNMFAFKTTKTSSMQIKYVEQYTK